MLEHVLDPSKKIDDAVTAYTLITTDGRVLSGLLVEKNDKGVVLRTPEKQTVRLARDEVEQLKKSDKSLMPDRILSDLTAQEAADLLEYICSQARAKGS
jgi:putative heme-binding domain-containing protein